jgi:hypothetical protein
MITSDALPPRVLETLRLNAAAILRRKIYAANFASRLIS